MADSVILEEEGSFLWDILEPRKIGWTRSPRYCTGTINWYLEFNPRRLNEEDKTEYISVAVYKLTQDDRGHIACVSLTIYDIGNIAADCASSGAANIVLTKEKFEKNGIFWYWKNVVPSKKMDDVKFSPLKLKFDVKTFGVRPGNLEMMLSRMSMERYKKYHVDDIDDDVDFEYYDTVLRTPDEDIMALKHFLIHYSPVFARIFKHDTQDDKIAIIEVEGIEGRVLKEMVYTLQKSRLRNPSSEMCLKLYEASDKYLMVQLKATCLDYLMDHLSFSNVCNVAKIAFKYKDEKLISAVKCYIRSKAGKVEKCKAWIKFAKEEPDIASEILKKKGKQ